MPVDSDIFDCKSGVAIFEPLSTPITINAPNVVLSYFRGIVTITVVIITGLEEFRRLCEHAFGTLENLDLDSFFRPLRSIRNCLFETVFI